MLVYHGSDSNFKHLRLGKNLVKCNSTLENEGIGIYFSTDISVAKSYGRYLYTLEINDKFFLDFRRRIICRLYVSKLAQFIYKQTNISILDYFSLQDLAERMYFGGQAISGVGREVYMLLDSNFSWYTSIPQYKINRIYSILRTYDKNNLKAYMFNYSIKNVGVIKDISDDIVRIVTKERCY